ncbi:SPASM domain-containing protein [Haemophilus parahaemolyticus]
MRSTYKSQSLAKWSNSRGKRCKFKKLCNGGCPKHRFVPVENDPNLHNYLCPSYRYFF